MSATIDWCRVDWQRANQLPPAQQSIHAVARWFASQAAAAGVDASEPARAVWRGLLDHTMRFDDPDGDSVKPELEARIARALRRPVEEVAKDFRSILRKYGGRRPYGLFKSSGHAYGKVRMEDLGAVSRALSGADPDRSLDQLLHERGGKIFGLGLAGLSQVAHVVRPDLYPVLNRRTDFSDWQQAASDSDYSRFVPLSVALRPVCDRLGFPRRWRFKYLDRYLEASWTRKTWNEGLGIPRGSTDALRRILLQVQLTSETRKEKESAAQVLDEYTPSAADDRERVYRAIRERRGQTEFRRTLLRLHRGRCQVSGCSVELILEAAHIHAYQSKADNHPRNGLLLRADLHTMFDLGLLWVDPASLAVQVSPRIHDPVYRAFHGRTLRHDSCRPSVAALRQHMEQVVGGVGK